MKTLSVEYIRKLLDYNPETGRLFWKFRTPDMFPDNSAYGPEWACRSWNSRFAGKEAGYIDKEKGYLKITIGRDTHYAHRLAWAIHYGRFPENDIDHKNGKKLENWIKNLRDVREAVNMQNQAKRRNNTSGVHGVYFQRGKWHAAFRANGRKIYVGSFAEIEKAKEAIRLARINHGGFTPRHGEETRLEFDL